MNFEGTPLNPVQYSKGQRAKAKPRSQETWVQGQTPSLVNYVDLNKSLTSRCLYYKMGVITTAMPASQGCCETGVTMTVEPAVWESPQCTAASKSTSRLAKRAVTERKLAGSL